VPTVTFHTLGCKLNFAETGTMAEHFREHQFDVAESGSAPDITVINTCTVTRESERKCRQVIRRVLRAHPDTFVIVTGCYAQLRPEEIADIPGVDAVLGAGEKFRIFDILKDFTKRDRSHVEVSCISTETGFGPAASRERTRAFLKIQDGCDYSCSFCTIPMARGRSRSQSVAQTLRDMNALAAEGYREVVLTGVNVGLFGSEEGESLTELVQEIEKHSSVERVRISSIEPNLVTDALIEAVACSPRMMPHFHMPLQSGDNHVLGSMRRRYRRDVYEDRVSRILDRIPDACIGADIIVGFPAEQRIHFQNTYSFLSDLPVSYLHVFTYSERPGTTALAPVGGANSGGIAPPERARRNRLLRLLSDRKRMAFYREHAGSERPVLWEGDRRNGRMFGFTDNYIRVSDRADPVLEGQIDTVRLGDISEDGSVRAERAVVLG
jgi:threonylcarbamoyladenosine tRNA methylthiotransferase MtaB